MAELVYAHDSGSCPSNWMRVRLPSTALLQNKRNRDINDGFDGHICSVLFFRRYIVSNQNYLKRANDTTYLAEHLDVDTEYRSFNSLNMIRIIPYVEE